MGQKHWLRAEKTQSNEKSKAKIPKRSVEWVRHIGSKHKRPKISEKPLQRGLLFFVVVLGMGGVYLEKT